MIRSTVANKGFSHCGLQLATADTAGSNREPDGLQLATADTAGSNREPEFAWRNKIESDMLDKTLIFVR